MSQPACLPGCPAHVRTKRTLCAHCPHLLPRAVLLQVLMAVPLLWLVVSVVCCWDSTMPRPVLQPDGSTFRANGSRQKAA
jgi:hypothetical protein